MSGVATLSRLKRRILGRGQRPLFRKSFWVQQPSFPEMMQSGLNMVNWNRLDLLAILLSQALATCSAQTSVVGSLGLQLRRQRPGCFVSRLRRQVASGPL